MIGDPFFEQTRFELTHAAIEASRGGSPTYEGTFVHSFLWYTASTFVDPLNMGVQSIQAWVGWKAGLHSTLMAGMMFEFVTGAIAFGFIKTLWDADDIWEGGGMAQHPSATGFSEAGYDESRGWPYDSYSY